METYLFYTTHLVMAACIAVLISAAWPESIQSFVKRMLELTSRISLLKKLKTIHYAFDKYHLCVKGLLINLLSIGLQISTQLLK